MPTPSARAHSAGAHHVRLNTGFLAAAEKNLLVWIAGRLPSWVNSDHLTLVALFAMAGTGASFWLSRYWPPALALVVVCLAINWFGDSLDGTVARVRRLERPRYGFYIDHVVDIVGITALIAGLACSGFMNPVIALALLVAYLLVAGEVFLATSVHRVFRMSFAGFGPTELRIVLAVGTYTLRHDPHVSLFGAGPLPLFDVGGIIAAAGLMVALGISVWRNASYLARLEPAAVQPRGLLDF